MGEVTVTVNGRPYRMACEDGQEDQLRELGDELAARVKDLASQVGQAGDAQLLVMAALITADELREQTRSGGDAAAIIAERDAIAQELESLRDAHASLKLDRSKDEAADALKQELEQAMFEIDRLGEENQKLRDAGQGPAGDAGLADEVDALRERCRALEDQRSESAADAASAAEAIDALSARVARLAEALRPH